MTRFGATRSVYGVAYPADPIPELKSQLSNVLVDALDGWSQANAACLVWTDQPSISKLRRGNLRRFSVEQLIRFLSRLDRRVELVIHHEARRYRPRVIRRPPR